MMYLSPAEREDNTNKFITKYCQHYSLANPRPVMRNPEVIDWHWNRLLQDYEGVDRDAVKRYLNKRNYKKVFLTSYWWYIIKHKRLAMDGFKCCGRNCSTPDDKELHVHHIDMTYAIRGEELLFMDGLQTLCSCCHENEHGKKKKKRRWGRKNVVVVEITNELSVEERVDNLIAVAKRMGTTDQQRCEEILDVLDDVMKLLSA